MTDTATSVLLPTGELRFRVQRSDDRETTHNVDVVATKLACEECERQHSLQQDEGGYYIPTVEFLQSLAARLDTVGIDECTPTLAYLVWTSVTREFMALKKNISTTQK
jgi:hypothetical protein